MKRPNTVLALVALLLRSAAARGWARIGPLGASAVLVALASSAAALMSLRTTPGVVYTQSVEEVLATPREHTGRTIWARGHVCDAIEHDPLTQVHHFRLTSGDQVLPVRYDRALPDPMTSDWDIEVVVEGVLEPSGVFTATRVIARCPSKYDARGPGPRWHCPASAER